MRSSKVCYDTLSFYILIIWVEWLNSFGKQTIDRATGSIKNKTDIVSSLYNKD